MIQWREQPVETGAQPLAVLYRSLDLADALRVAGTLEVARESPLLIVARAVREQVFAHLRTRSTELGGLLVGEAFTREMGAEAQGGIAVVRVLEAIAGDDTASTALSLELSTSVWDKARARLANGRLVVGWYHSHPYLGAFFSSTDRRTQGAFFAHPYSVGWVIDPFAIDPASAERWYIGPQARELTSIVLAMHRADL